MHIIYFRLNKEPRTQKDKALVDREVTCPSIIDLGKISNGSTQNPKVKEEIPFELAAKYKDFKPGNILK